MLPGLILQHAETGPPGRLGAWARSRGLPYQVHRSWEVPPEFDPREFAFVASLGSARSANETDVEWIGAEIALLGHAVEADVPVLGLCWGGQALSLALEGTVEPAPFHEKEWLAIASADPEVPPGPWLHYHTEIFTVPPGAVELARSPAGPAAFRLGPHLGLQFHPEADAEMAHVWAAKDPEQTERSLAALDDQGDRWSAAAGTLADELFDAWWARAPRPVPAGDRQAPSERGGAIG
jgi:GMP synthase-like glutamine amidotransferase